MKFIYLRTLAKFYLVCGSNFVQHGSNFCRNAQKKDEKS